MTLLEARKAFHVPGRKRRGITQLELERRSGVDRTRISKIELEDDPNPTINTVRALEAALHLPPGTLIFGSRRRADRDLPTHATADR